MISRTAGLIEIGATEEVHTDAMRCLAGMCNFMTTSYSPSSLQSFAYRVNTSSGELVSKTPVKGDCAHLHEDYSTNHLYTLCTDTSSGRNTVIVWEVAGPIPEAVLDITAVVKNGRTRPGQTTHCSAFHSMYVGVDLGGNGQDLIITVDLPSAKVASTTTLEDPLWKTLWARCDGSNEIGGISWAPGSSRADAGIAFFGTLDTTNGKFQNLLNISIPPGLEPSGLLTETETEQSVATFYSVRPE